MLSIHVDDEDMGEASTKSYSLEGGYFIKNNIVVAATGYARARGSSRIRTHIQTSRHMPNRARARCVAMQQCTQRE